MNHTFILTKSLSHPGHYDGKCSCGERDEDIFDFFTPEQAFASWKRHLENVGAF